MDKYIYDERNGLWYELQGGLLHSLLGAAHLAYWLMGSAALAVLYTDLLISGSEFRQTQEYHVYNVHNWGLFPLSTVFPGGWDGMRECRPSLPGALMQGDPPTFRSVNRIRS